MGCYKTVCNYLYKKISYLICNRYIIHEVFNLQRFFIFNYVYNIIFIIAWFTFNTWRIKKNGFKIHTWS